MTARGKIVFTLVFLLLVGVGIRRWWPKLQPGGPGTAVSVTTSDTGDAKPGAEPKFAETQFSVPRLDRSAAYQPKDGVVDIELSEYPGYAGLIVANGGLEPNDQSVFAQKHGFKVRIKLSEEESW